jgi:hypothetical protein
MRQWNPLSSWLKADYRMARASLIVKNVALKFLKHVAGQCKGFDAVSDVNQNVKRG